MSVSPSRSFTAHSSGHAGSGVIFVTAALLMIGVVMIASTGATLDRPATPDAIWKSVFGRQVIFALLGFAILLGVSVMGFRSLGLQARAQRPALLVPLLLLVLACVALGAALTPGVGVERNGARRWLPLGPPSSGLVFQPSEFAKVALVVFLAVFLARRRARVRSFWTTVLPGLMAIGMVAGLIGVEDFGTAALLALVGGAMLLAGGCRIMHLAVMALPGIGAAVYLVASEPYRAERLTTFFNIWADPRGAGYHPIQSLATIASGDWYGRGLGAGVQKYGYLPAIQTDFIFAGICEEMGVLGGLVVIFLFLTFLVLGLGIARQASDGAAQLLAFGATLVITLQAVINIAVVTVLVPTKGIALPFVSAGGSGIVFLAMLAGLLSAVARRSAEDVVYERGVCGAGRRNVASATLPGVAAVAG